MLILWQTGRLLIHRKDDPMDRYDFDEEIDRKDTSSLKWDRYKDKDVIPLWVADMDFKAPGPVISALRDRVDHGVFGYTLPPDELYHAIIDYLYSAHGWQVERSWIVPVPGVVSGLNLACRAVGQPGDRVMVPVPVYPPFFDAPHLSGKSLDRVGMVFQNGRLTFDWNALESAITPRTALFLLCSPHNPGGTVFRHDELERLAYLVKKHDLFLCSDEIHCDLVFEGTHRPTAAACPDIQDRTITLMAPSKTYNIPGLGFSFAVIPEPNLRDAFRQSQNGVVPHVNALGYTAALAAYKNGGDWLKRVLAYLKINRDLVHKRINRMPGLSALRPEGTYLTWIDARETGLDDPAGFFEEKGVGLSDGRYFGTPGLLRLNFGCRKELLLRALDRMEKALNSPTAG